jgi:hypothetical protein
MDRTRGAGSSTTAASGVIAAALIVGSAAVAAAVSTPSRIRDAAGSRLLVLDRRAEPARGGGKGP